MEDFRNAIVGSRQDVLDKLSEANDQDDKTLLEQNATIYAKQAEAYSSETKCKYVAISDWESLILLRFSPFPQKEYNNEGHRVAKALVLDHSQRDQFRKALLGFLLLAYEAAGAKPRI